MKKTTLALGSAFILLTVLDAVDPAPADAQSASGNFAPPPAVTLSPDLSAPWMLQFRHARESRRLGRQARNSLGRTPLDADQVRRYREPRFALVRTGLPQRQERAPARAKYEFDPKFEPQIVSYEGSHAPGTIVIDTESRFLYLVEGDGKARRYGVGVGKPGFEWAGSHTISRKAEWPDWRPPAQMIVREAEKGHHLPEFVEGGPQNPLGARALYLGSSLYRVHGTNQPWTIGRAVSSGCIRMRNEDVIDLYERVPVGAKVFVS